MQAFSNKAVFDCGFSKFCSSYAWLITRWLISLLSRMWFEPKTQCKLSCHSGGFCIRLKSSHEIHENCLSVTIYFMKNS